jgi:hypothetical protein
VTAPIEVAVYEPDATTLIAVIPRRDGVQGKDELNGVAASQFNLHLDDALLASKPQLLDPFNVVKMKPAGAVDYVHAWQLEELAPVQVSGEEQAGRRVTISGRQIRSILDTAPVLGSSENRVFDFSSPTGPWYVGADWDTPVGVVWTADTTARAGNPRDWPDPTAEWIWSTDPEASSPPERNWFRGEFTLAALTDVTIWASCDNSMSLRLNGQVIATTDPTDLFAWRGMIQPYRVTLPAGTHLVAAWVDNAASTGNNPGAFLCTVGTADAQGTLDTVLLRTNTTDWLVHAAANPPGWHAAQILIKLLDEAQSDGYLPGVTWDFTDTLDSDGQAWDDLQDEQIPVGTDLLTVSQRWAGTVYDIHMTHDLVLQAWKRRGSDLSGTVALTAGVNVTSLAPTVRYWQIRNVAVGRHTGGLFTLEDTGSSTAYGKRAFPLALGDAGSTAQAEQDAQAALDELIAPAVTLPLSMTSAVGPQPTDDFNLGDTISAPALLTGQADARVLTWTMIENENRIDWTLDLYPEA